MFNLAVTRNENDYEIVLLIQLLYAYINAETEENIFKSNSNQITK